MRGREVGGSAEWPRGEVPGITRLFAQGSGGGAGARPVPTVSGWAEYPRRRSHASPVPKYRSAVPAANGQAARDASRGPSAVTRELPRRPLRGPAAADAHALIGSPTGGQLQRPQQGHRGQHHGSGCRPIESGRGEQGRREARREARMMVAHDEQPPRDIQQRMSNGNVAQVQQRHRIVIADQHVGRHEVAWLTATVQGLRVTWSSASWVALKDGAPSPRTSSQSPHPRAGRRPWTTASQPRPTDSTGAVASVRAIRPIEAARSGPRRGSASSSGPGTPSTCANTQPLVALLDRGCQQRRHDDSSGPEDADDRSETHVVAAQRGPGTTGPPDDAGRRRADRTRVSPDDSWRRNPNGGARTRPHANRASRSRCDPRHGRRRCLTLVAG